MEEAISVEWLLISFVAVMTIVIVNRFVISILLIGHAALREGQPDKGADRRRPRFGWIMVRLPAVPMLDYQPPRQEPPSVPSENRPGKRRMRVAGVETLKIARRIKGVSFRNRVRP